MPYAELWYVILGGVIALAGSYLAIGHQYRLERKRCIADVYWNLRYINLQVSAISDEFNKDKEVPIATLKICDIAKEYNGQFIFSRIGYLNDVLDEYEIGDLVMYYFFWGQLQSIEGESGLAHSINMLSGSDPDSIDIESIIMKLQKKIRVL